MDRSPLPLVRDLVLVGGGHAHALVLRMWGMTPLPGVRLTLVNPGPAAPYTGMLPGHIAGHYTRDAVMIDLVRLARFAGARLILDRAVGLDQIRGRVLLAGRDPLRYDVASLDIGISSDLPGVPGFAEHAQAAKPLGSYAARWDAFLAQGRADPAVVILGGGVGGVELALASAYRLRRAGARPSVTVLERGSQALPGLGRAARARLLAALAEAEIDLVLGVTAAAVGPDHVLLTDGRRLPSAFTLSVAGARPQDWLAETWLSLTDGFVTVGPTLQSSDPAVFAAGDTAHMRHAPRPKAGVYAVRQAPILHHNLRAALTGGAMRTYQPQRDYLKLVSLGDRRAVADIFGMRAGGGWLWRLKDRIDTRFMAKFADYPAMPTAPLPDPAPLGLADAMGPKPLCGGCGAKVGAGALQRALAALPAPRRPDVLSGPGDDAAILRVGDGVQVVTTDHLRAFTADPRVMAELTAVHALGDIWAMGAVPQAALAQITLPRASPDLHADMLAEVMAAAAAVFTAAGADIVGGHTSIGAELTVGFTVTGLVAGLGIGLGTGLATDTATGGAVVPATGVATDRVTGLAPDPATGGATGLATGPATGLATQPATGLATGPVTKAGAAPGCALILTKPLGTGTILAAEMAMTRLPGLILGEAVAACLHAMAQPQGQASAILTPHARAMTDVTGFGLAGHLLEMLDASACAATIRLADLPRLPAADALAAAGIASSLAPANREQLAGRITGPDDPLLYDPQTCGGLLAAVPADVAQAVLADLRAAGFDAAIIGHTHAGPPHLTCV